MTREKIMSMPAGREMDALIAWEIMGWTLNPQRTQWDTDNPGYAKRWRSINGFNPSSDIAAAWEVVEKMMKRGSLYFEFAHNEWFVTNRPVDSSIASIRANCDGQKTGKPSLPLAICRFAMLCIL